MAASMPVGALADISYGARVQTHGLSSLLSTEDQLTSPNPKRQTENEDASSESLIAITLRTLRMLDLHRLVDWPNITTETFRPPAKEGHARQKARVQTGEWILYKLFELWDLRETKISLRPYFPALETVQSTKLRVSLYQWLNKLKETRGLGRDFSLRRSMLDEFKGERFEELLFLFSSAVLKKVISEKQRTLSLVREVCIEPHVPLSGERELLDPMILAYRTSLTGLRTRRQHEERYLHHISENLKHYENVMDSRIKTATAIASDCKAIFKSQDIDLDGIKKPLRQEIFDKDRLVGVFISGEPDNDRDTYFEQDFQHIWDYRHKLDRLTQPDIPTKSLLLSLTQRVDEQRTRLENWRTFQSELSRRNEALIVIKSPTKTSAGGRSKQNSKATPSSPSKSPQKGVRPSSFASARPKSQSGPKIVAGRDPSTRPKQDQPAWKAAIERSSRQLSKLTMESMGNSITPVSSAQNLEERVESQHSGITAGSPASFTKPKLSPSPFQDPVVSEVETARGTSSKLPRNPSRLPRPGNMRSRSEVRFSSDIAFGLDALKLDSDRRASPEQTQLKQEISGRQGRSQASMPRRNQSVTAGSARPDADTVKHQSPVPMSNESSPPIITGPDKDPLTEKLTLSERTRESLAQYEILNDNITDAPKGHKPTQDSRGPPSSYRKGHQKSRSVQLSRPRYPVNPFGDAEGSSMIVDSSFNPPLSTELAAPQTAPKLQSAMKIPMSTDILSDNKTAEDSNRIEQHDSMSEASPAPSSWDDRMDAASIFKPRNRLRMSPPPATSSPSSWMT